jgi:hypothetical protein
MLSSGAMRASTEVLLVTSAWLLLALALGASGLLRDARPPLPQLVIAGLTAIILALYWAPTAFRRWAAAVDLRALVLIHVTRFVGLYFLALYARGELPYAFAVPGGWGDIGVATAALAVCLFARPAAAAGQSAIFAWNLLGLVDIVFVVLTAARLWTADPESMRALLSLPLSLLPTFLVPIIIATHIIIFARLARPTS